VRTNTTLELKMGKNGENCEGPGKGFPNNNIVF